MDIVSSELISIKGYRFFQKKKKLASELSRICRLVSFQLAFLKFVWMNKSDFL